MKKVWIILLVNAVILISVSLLMDTTVSTGYGDRVHNIGLQSRQQSLLLLGGFLLVAGVILYGIEQLRAKPGEELKAQSDREQLRLAEINAQENAQRLRADLAMMRAMLWDSAKSHWMCSALLVALLLLTAFITFGSGWDGFVAGLSLCIFPLVPILVGYFRRYYRVKRALLKIGVAGDGG
jgi:hypothetical protein